MSARLPPRAPPIDRKQDFAEFVLPDGRLIFIRRDAVNVIYDGIDQTCNVVTASNVIPVPYTAIGAMEILYG